MAQPSRPLERGSCAPSTERAGKGSLSTHRRQVDSGNNRAVILKTIRKVEKPNAFDVASRILQRVSSVYRYAIQTGRATYNLAADLAGSLKTGKVTHRAALSFQSFYRN
jgi:hypothetical protein